ncbi:ABC transporter ATP-binding protein [Bacillus sp. Marseille-P3661]|uniref:ABC transporter ATP-binding protein n=1 Tax=Bacillus sp. Marseille-P3661 TaxID=1936234 RepID=UPI0015E17D95|nr:ABC transporter ATP-binding protein [Bacillus sp. Marseille-P3661]
MLQIKQLSFAYGDKNVLHDINLKVESGEAVAIIGHNGAGKTTLLKCVSGINKGGSGDIQFLNNPISNIPPYSDSRKGMSYSPDQKPIFPRLTVQDNLEMGGLREKNKRKLEENEELIYSIFPKLYELRQRNAGVLSGGERQMLALGIALMSSPKLVLLDEPSAGLSPLLVGQLFEAIRKINHEFGISFLIVEQSVQLVEEVVNKIYVLQSGKILAEGTPIEIKQLA